MTTKTTDIAADTVLCQNCRISCDPHANFCGRCGQQLKGSSLTIIEEPLVPLPKKRVAWPITRSLLIVVVLCLALLVVGMSLFTFNYEHRLTQTPPLPHATSIAMPALQVPGGLVWFYDLRAHNDAIALLCHDLPVPPKGKVYVLWLLNPHRPDQFMHIGPLLPDKAGILAVHTDKNSLFNSGNLDLRLLFPKVVLTLENANTPLHRPGKQIVLQGSLDPHASNAVTLLLVR